MICYKLTENVLTIYDCYKTHKWNMRGELKRVKESAAPGETKVFERSIFSLKIEWICHKFLYMINYKRGQTKDADLDNPSDRPEWMYIVCGLLVWIFVW